MFHINRLVKVANVHAISAAVWSAAGAVGVGGGVPFQRTEGIQYEWKEGELNQMKLHNKRFSGEREARRMLLILFF